MQNLKILNKKQIKKILEIIKKQYGCKVNLDYAFLQNEKNRVYIANKEFADIDLTKLRINSVGLYFGELRSGELRLTIEGSQIIGPYAKENVVELDEKESKEWMKGYDLVKETNTKGFVIIKHKEDYLGCGKVKENKIFNYVPKNRRSSFE